MTSVPRGKPQLFRNGRDTARLITMAPKPVPSPEERRSPAEEENYNREDCVETASVDSFPASDPPGWICTKATAKPGRKPGKRRRS